MLYARDTAYTAALRSARSRRMRRVAGPLPSALCLCLLRIQLPIHLFMLSWPPMAPAASNMSSRLARVLHALCLQARTPSGSQQPTARCSTWTTYDIRPRDRAPASLGISKLNAHRRARGRGGSGWGAAVPFSSPCSSSPSLSPPCHRCRMQYPGCTGAGSGWRWASADRAMPSVAPVHHRHRYQTATLSSCPTSRVGAMGVWLCMPALR
jgi:hypothetical protein